MYLRMGGGSGEATAPARRYDGEESPPLGLGSYPGEIRRGPDGRFYRWTAHLDGLGNGSGIWTVVSDTAKRAWRALVETMRKVLARAVLSNGSITLATAHVTTPLDNA